MNPRPDSIETIRQGIIDGSRSALDVCQTCLEHIERLEPRLHAFRTVARDRALDRAAAIDRDRHGDPAAPPLLGVPVAVKDNICTRHLRTTAASRVLEHYVPPYDATVVERLEAAGAVIIGKTNCDEFAMGSSTENSAFGPTHNPWATTRTPGGSSGGSAAIVAAGAVPIALGSDTGGSIRQPAALCGIVGLKPTYGRVSRYGLLAFASSLDQIGPLTRSVRDAATVLAVIGGADPRDATTAGVSIETARPRLDGNLTGIRVGVPWAIIEDGVDEAVGRAFRESLEVLVARGATLTEIALPHAGYAIPVYYLVATAEASSNLARYDGVRYGLRAPADTLQEMYDRTREGGFGAEVKRRIMLGTYVLSAGYYDAYYLKAQRVRTLIRRDYDSAFERVDIVAMPTSPTPAFTLGERIDDPLKMYLADVFTVSANLAGLPAISVPCGLTGDRLPIGLQLTGRPFDEATMLGVADAYERETSWSGELPEVSVAAA